jgi:hypothetical protein
MTWYTDTCCQMAMGLLYGLDHRVIEIYDYVMIGLGSNEFFVNSAPFTNVGHGYGFASSVDHPRLNLVGLLVYDGMCTIFGVPVLYYRSLGTVPTLPKNG